MGAQFCAGPVPCGPSPMWAQFCEGPVPCGPSSDGPSYGGTLSDVPFGSFSALVFVRVNVRWSLGAREDRDWCANDTNDFGKSAARRPPTAMVAHRATVVHSKQSQPRSRPRANPMRGSCHRAVASRKHIHVVLSPFSQACGLGKLKSRHD
jgi:hypothetical protein